MSSRTHEWSPDLNPLDFYFWEYIGQKVYAEEFTTENMKNRAQDVQI